MPGARRTHCLACTTKKTHAGQHRYAEITPALPAQWLYGLLRALAGDRAFLPPSPAELLNNRLDPSVGGPRPRDLTVRAAPHDLCRYASIATRLTSGDEWPSRPSCRGGMVRIIHVFRISERTIFLRPALDSSGKTVGGFFGCRSVAGQRRFQCCCSARLRDLTAPEPITPR
jgi:hypothetical protein